jgi:hypothetical protein
VSAAIEIEIANAADAAVRWRLSTSLSLLLGEINSRAPMRRRRYDALGTSQHRPRIGARDLHLPNPRGVVTAIDITHDPRRGCDCNVIAEALRESRDPRIETVIWNGRIFSSRFKPWLWRAHRGSSCVKFLHIAVVDEAKPWAVSHRP